MPSSTPPTKDNTMVPAIDPMTGKIGLAVPAGSGVITARQAGGLIDMKMDVDPNRAGVKPVTLFKSSPS